MKKIIIVLVLVLVLGYIVMNKKGEDRSPIVENPMGGSIEEVIKNSIANIKGVASSKVEIVSMEEKEWSNACLGLFSSQEMCAAVMTPGYEVKAIIDGKSATFRTDIDGSVVREDK